MSFIPTTPFATASMPSFDAAVVGSGIVGSATAYALGKAGLRVAHILGDGLPGSATAAGMGHIALMDDSPAQFALGRRSQELWASFLAGPGERIDQMHGGSTWIAADKAQLEACEAKAAYYKSHGARAEVWTAQELQDREPALRKDLLGALHLPDDACVYQPAAAALLAQLSGAETVAGHAEEVTAHEVTLRGGQTISARAVILCTGSHPQLLAEPLPIRRRKGHLMVTAKGQPICQSQIIELGYLTSAHGSDDFSVAFNLQPRPGGQCLIGSSREFGVEDSRPSRRVLAAMLQTALSYAPGLANAQILRSWAGHRPALPDHLPAIGQLPSGIWVNLGHEGLGITNSFGSAELLASLITGSPASIDPSPYRPDRFGAAA